MNGSDAIKILSQIAQVYDSAKPFESQMGELSAKFVPSIQGTTLHSVDSLTGKTVKWIRGYETKRAHKKSVTRIFWDALKSLPDNSSCSLSKEKRIDLYKTLRKDFESASNAAEKHPTLNELETECGEKEQQIPNHSLLKKERKPCNSKTLEEVFGLTPRTDQYYQYLSSFTNNDTDATFNESLSQIKEALQRDQNLKSQMVEEPLEREKTRFNCARELWQKVQNGQPVLFAGSYGHKIKNLSDLFQAIKEINKFIEEKTGETTKLTTLLEKENHGNPEKQIQELLKASLRQIISELPLKQAQKIGALLSTEKLPLSKSLIGRLASGLFGSMPLLKPAKETEEVIQWMIQVTGDQLQHSYIAHLIGMMLCMLPDASLLETISWLRSNFEKFLHEDTQQQAIQELEQRILQSSAQTIQSLLNPFNEVLTQSFNLFQNLIPSEISRHFDVDHLYRSGPIWLRVEKQPEDGYTVSIYCDSSSSFYHANGNGKTISWPLILQDIDENKLGPEFFEPFLFHHFETDFSRTFHSTVHTLYKSLKVLEGSKKSSVRPKEHIGKTEDNLIDAILITNDNPIKITFQMRLHALAAFCSSFIKSDGTINKDDTKEVELALKSAISLQGELNSLSQILSDDERKIAIDTLTHIQMALAKPPALSTPEDLTLLAKPIAELLQQAGINKANFRNHGDSLRLLLGDDLMELIDLMLDTTDVLPPLTKKAAAPAKPKQQGLTVNVVRSLAFQIAFQSLKYGYFLYRFSTTPLFLIYTMTPSLMRHMPSTLQQLYYTTHDLYTRACSELFANIILKLFFGNSGNILVEAKAAANKWAKRCFEAPEVDLRTYRSPEIHQPSFTIPAEGFLFNQKSTPQLTSSKLISNTSSLVPDPVTPTNVTAYLKKWSDSNLHLFEDIIYLTNKIRQLPVPFTSDFWQQVTDIDQCIEILHKIATQIIIKTSNDQIWETQEAKFYLARFHILAIMETLTKRQMGKLLDKYFVSPASYHVWRKSDLCILTNPDLIGYVKKLDRYFDQHEDQPTPQALFHLGYASDELTNTICPGEDAFYLEFFKHDPSLNGKIGAILQNSWENHVKENDDIVAVLLAMAYLVEDNKSVLPRNYRLLKAQAALCNLQLLFYHPESNKKESLKAQKFQFSWKPVSFIPSIDVKTLDSFQESLRVGLKWIKSEPFSAQKMKRAAAAEEHLPVIKPFKEYFENATSLEAKIKSVVNGSTIFGPFNCDCLPGSISRFDRKFLKHKATQSQITIDRYSDHTTAELFRNAFPNDHHHWGKLIHAEDYDQIPRLIAFLQRDLDVLFKDNTSGFSTVLGHHQSSPKLLYVISIMFKHGRLKELLKSNPRFSITLGNFIEQLLKHPLCKMNVNLVVFLCASIRSYCRKYAPQYMSKFPKLPELFKQQFANKDQSYFHVMAQAYGDLNEVTHPTDRDDAIEALCVIRIASHLYRDEESYLKWRPLIRRRLEDKAFATRVLKSALNVAGIAIPETYFQNMTYDPIAISFRFETDGPYAPSVNFDLGWYANLPSHATTFSSLFPHKKKLTKLHGASIELISEGNNWKVKLKSTDNQYLLLNPKQTNQLRRILISNGFKVDSTFQIWLSEPNSKQRHLLCESINPRKDHRVIVDLTEKDGIYKLTKPHKASPSDVDKNGIKALEQFSPIIEYSLNSDATQITSFRFEVDLIFDVQEMNGTLVAKSRSQFPGYFIARQQNVPALRPYGSHLLLENSAGKQLVLLNRSQWQRTIQWHLLKYAQPFATQTISIENDSTSSEYYVYELTDRGTLTSDDPLALTHILHLQILLNNLSEAIVISDQLFALARRVPLPLKLWNMIIPIILLPPMYRHLRIKLLAALEENRLLFPNSAAADDKREDTLYTLGFIQAIYQDLQYLHNLSQINRSAQMNGSLNSDKEWFLYKLLFRKIQEAFLQFGNDNKQLAWLKEPTKAEAIIEIFLLPPALSSRYAQLKKEYGLADTHYIRYFRAAKTYWNTSETSYAKMLDPLYLARFIANKVAPEGMMIVEEIVSNLTQFFNIQDEILSLFRTKFVLKKMGNTQILYLRKKINPDEPYSPCLELENMTPDKITHDFIYYYSIARGERSKSEKERLILLLSRIYQRYEQDIDGLVELLQFICTFPVLFPSSEEALVALKAPKPLPDLTIIEIYALTIEEKENINNSIRKSSDQIDGNFDLYKYYTLLYDLAKNSNLQEHRASLETLINTTQAPVAKKMAAFLLIVDNDPKGYLTTTEFHNRFTKSFRETNLFYDHYQYEQWINFWSKLQTRYFGALGATSIAKSVFQSGVNGKIWTTSLTFSGELLGSFIGDGVGDAITATQVAVRQASKAINTALQLSPASANGASTSSEANRSNSATCQELDSQDHAIDLFLKQQFSKAFEVTKQESTNEKRFEPFAIPTNASKSMRDRYERINQSITDFYQRDLSRESYSLHTPEMLWNIYINIADCINHLQATLKRDEAALLSLINPKKSLVHRHRLTFDHLVSFMLTGDISFLGQDLNMSPESLQKLDFLVSSQLVRGSRLKQLERTQKLLEEAAAIDPEKERVSYYEKIERIAEELRTTRAYKSGQYCQRFVLRLLCFEYYSNKLIWPKQLELVSGMLFKTNGHSLLHMMPSLGKTACIPLISSFEADGERVIIHVWPTAMLDTNTGLMSAQYQSMYKKPINVLHFERYNPPSLSHLEALKVMLQRAMLNGEPVNTTREDLQAIELSFKEALYCYDNNQFRSEAEIRDVIWTLNEILIFLKSKAHFIGDEAHEIFHRPEQLNYPVGTARTVEERYYNVIERCAMLLAEDKEILAAIQNNKKVNLTQKDIERIAREIDKNQQADFVPYVTGQLKKTPQHLRHSDTFSETALVKGMLTVLLPKTLEKEALVDFGDSIANPNEEHARPSDGNMSPLEQSLLRSAYEALTKTFILYLHKGLSPDKVLKALVWLNIEAQTEKNKKNISIENTEARRFLRRILGNKDPDSSEARAILTRNTEFICFYIREFINEQIKYWRENITSNVQNFGSMAATQYHDTGTPYNDGTYPSFVEIFWDKGTDGEALHIISNKCPVDGIRLLNSDKPKQILAEILAEYFKTESDFTALIDGSAQLQGLSNDEVAHQMLAFAKVHRPDIKAIVYFQKKKSHDLLVCLEVESQTCTPLIEIDERKIPPKSRLTYYDQRHGFAADVNQKRNGKAINLIGPRVKLYRLLQENFRMRGIKYWQKLMKVQKESLADLVHQTQEVHCAMTKETARMILTQLGRTDTTAIPTFRDITEFAIQNESYMGDENYFAFNDQIENVAHRFALDDIQSSSNVDQMLGKYRKYKATLVKRIEDDPAKIWGSCEEEFDTDEAIAFTRKTTVERFTESDHDEIQRRIESLTPPPMPEKIKGYKNGDIITTDMDVGQTVTVSVNTTQEQEQQQEQHQEQEQNTTVVTSKKRTAHYSEMAWSDDLDPYTEDFLDTRAKTKRESSRHPQYLSLQELLQQSLHTEFRSLKNNFDTRIWFSNNFLPAVINDEAGVSLGSAEQRELIHLLVIVHETGSELKIESVGCLSIRDGNILRQCIDRASKPEKMRAFIYDVPNRTISWCGGDFDAETLHKNRDFQRILVQLKYLNGDNENYNAIERTAFEEWINATSKPKELYETFKLIYQERPGEVKFKNSYVEKQLRDQLSLFYA